MAKDGAYSRAVRKIKQALRSGATKLDLSGMGLDDEEKLTKLPAKIGELTQLRTLNLFSNRLMTLPEEIGQLTQLRMLYLSRNCLTALPEEIGQLTQLRILYLSHNKLTRIPEGMGQLNRVRTLRLDNNGLSDLPSSLAQLKQLMELNIHGNPLNPELAAAYAEGLDAVKKYLLLRAKPEEQMILNEAKLILVGEGEVGKTCLMDALEGLPWKEHDTTHGIQIRTIPATDLESGRKITLNGWDFGGQRVYRPTHQLFFSAPAVYLVVWKPREGTQQGLVEDWIRLIKHREPEAKILVVATHGGPQQRQPDIDRQELWDRYGKDMVVGFFHVDSKPPRSGIEELKEAIASVAADLPGMGRSVPKRWEEVRKTLAMTEKAYLKMKQVREICREHKMGNNETDFFVTISHRLGHLIHYEHDETIGDMVVLKPDWLATAISFVLDDKETRDNHGLVRFSRLSQLWNDPQRDLDDRYPEELHPIFLRLMERFDLSYRVAELFPSDPTDSLSLIGQLVLGERPETDLAREWPPYVPDGDIQQVQICKIIDDKGESAPAEGLFYQLIVRLHKYSLGRLNYNDSVHWQRGLVLDADYNGRARLEHKGNDVHITVRAPYTQGFLTMLTSEVKYLVDEFWEGLLCEVMVPCVRPCGKNNPGTARYEVEILIENKRRGYPEYLCHVCKEWQDIDQLLRNAPVAQPMDPEFVFAEFTEIKEELVGLRQELVYQGNVTIGRFNRLDTRTRSILSYIDDVYVNLLQILTDEAKDGPRLFSFEPVDRNNFNPAEWIRTQFRLTLWCEHSRLPLPALNLEQSHKGVYEIELTRDWFKRAGPYLKMLTGTLGLALPVASSAIELILSDDAYDAIEEQLEFSTSVIEATIDEVAEIGEFIGETDSTTLQHGAAIVAKGAAIRELHTLLKRKDPSFGGLVRVRNKRQEFLWVHEQFASEY